MSKINISEIAVGDLFSESNHLIVTNRTPTTVKFKHLSSGEEVEFSNEYVSDLLKTADQYSKEVKVTREDSHWTKVKIDAAIKKGTFTQEDAPAIGEVEVQGIRSLFENIFNDQCFTVIYRKKDEKLSDKKYKELRDAQIQSALAEIEKTASQRKGVKNKAEEVLKQIQENPITKIIEGEKRKLRGFKKTYTSRDGLYYCEDVDIVKTEKENGIRPVNIVTIEELIFDGVRFFIEK